MLCWFLVHSIVIQMNIYIHILFHSDLLQDIEHNFLCYTVRPCLSILVIFYCIINNYEISAKFLMGKFLFISIVYSVLLWKINKQNPQLDREIKSLGKNRVGRLERGTLMPCDNNSSAGKRKILFFNGKDSANEKPQTLGYCNSPCQLPFPLYKRALLAFPCWTLHAAHYDCRP